MTRAARMIGLFALAAGASLPREMDPLRPLEPGEDDGPRRLTFDAPPIGIQVHRDPAPLPAWEEPRPQRHRTDAPRKLRGIEALPHKKQARKAERAARRKSRGR